MIRRGMKPTIGMCDSRGSGNPAPQLLVIASHSQGTPWRGRSNLNVECRANLSNPTTTPGLPRRPSKRRAPRNDRYRDSGGNESCSIPEGKRWAQPTLHGWRESENRRLKRVRGTCPCQGFGGVPQIRYFPPRVGDRGLKRGDGQPLE
jgi:hypothetical protein